jgi:hypothetical protein
MHNLLNMKCYSFCLKVSPTCFGPHGPSSGSTYQNLTKVTISFKNYQLKHFVIIVVLRQLGISVCSVCAGAVWRVACVTCLYLCLINCAFVGKKEFYTYRWVFVILSAFEDPRVWLTNLPKITIIIQLAKMRSALMNSERSLPDLQSPTIGPCRKPLQSSSHFDTLFLDVPFRCYRLIYVKIYVVPFPDISRPKRISHFPCLLHVSAFSLIWN